jgi:predicted RNA-binding protein YlqC (UPF0109 family)
MADEGGPAQRGGPDPDDQGRDLGEVRGGPAEGGEQAVGAEGVEDREGQGDDGARDEVGLLSDVLAFLARSIVDEPDQVRVEAEPDDRGVILRLFVAPDDMGKVIGRNGRVAKALRELIRAAAMREGKSAIVEIIQ